MKTNFAKLLKENERTWTMGAHYTASTTEDIELARALYEQRIQDLETEVKMLRAQNEALNSLD